MILRIIDLEGNFIRDDFTYDEEKEIGLNVEAPQGLYKIEWNFETESWEEGLSEEEIDELTKPQPHEPTEVEILQQTVDSIFTDILPSLFN